MVAKRPDGDWYDDSGRECRICGEWKPETAFKPTKKYKYPYCRECYNLKALTYRYGISLETIQDLFSKGCAACGTSENLVIDHDHSCCPSKGKACGKCVKAALCSSCNVAIGYIEERPERAYALADYLERIGK